MAAATASRGSRRFVAAGFAFLVLFQAAAVLDLPRGTLAVLGVHGFVLHVLLGKACALVPAYFDRSLAAPRALALALPATTLGAIGLAAWTRGAGGGVGVTGAGLWTAGVAGTLAILAWTIRDNPTGSETGTGDANAHRRDVDRAANAVIPVALAYLAAGAYETLAVVAGLPTLVGAWLPGAVHLLAAGGAVLVLLGVGFRLLPRFLVASPPRPLVAVSLFAGALGPALLLAEFGGGPLFRAGAALEAVAVTGFAGAYTVLYARSTRDRVGFHAVLAAVASGVAGVGIGLGFATGAVAPLPAAVDAHLRLNVLGLLGLAVVGVAYQFYPPTVGRWPYCDDRTALASILALAGGLWLEAGGRLAGHDGAVLAGTLLGLGGALTATYLVGGAFASRR